MGLLNYLTATSLDEDYAHVSARRAQGAEGGGTPDRPRRMGLLGWFVLGVFGLLLMTAAVQTSREEPVRRSSMDSLVAQVNEGRAELAAVREEADRLRTEVEDTRSLYLSASDQGRALADQLERLGVASGTVPVSGPGLEIVVDDGASGAPKSAVLDTDLQILVNGLWAAGAEAVAINGQRLSNLSAIRTGGDAVTVNFRSLSPPYTVNAIGDPDELAARFAETEGASWWFNLKSLYDMQFSTTSKDDVTLPAVELPRLRHARSEDAQSEDAQSQKQKQGDR